MVMINYGNALGFTLAKISQLRVIFIGGSVAMIL